MVLGGVAGLAVATVAVPAALGAAGFTGAGIAAGSLAAKMMSAAAVANGGGVATGSAVDALQSVGAAGLSAVGAKEWGGERSPRQNAGMFPALLPDVFMTRAF
nr:interferon alpha-inducible protein 27-like protein 2 [Zootoca vivipara]